MILTTSFIGWLLLGEGGREVKRREEVGNEVKEWGVGEKKKWKRVRHFLANQRDSVCGWK